MPSDDKNIVEFPNKAKEENPKNGKKNKQAKERKPHKSIGWIIGVIILILISITFILPTTIFTSTGSSQIVFGKYNGKKISLELDNFFYYQLQTIANYYAQQYGGTLPQTALGQVYLEAFQSSVIYEAVSEMADKAKIEPSSDAITKAVIDLGYYNDENGDFDSERYKSATDSEKASAQKMAELSLPYTMVMSDIQAAKIPSAETDFIASLSNDARSFDYLVIGAENYGDEEARTYANNNPEPFVQIDLSAVTYATEAEANDILASLTSGEITFESASETSVDGYKSNKGKIGLVFKYTLDSMLSQSGVADASDLVFSTAKGSYAGPYYTSAGYTIFRVDESPAMADLSDPSVLSAVKEYIAANDNAIMAAYLAGVANDAYAVALEDVDKAIADFNLEYYSVDDVAKNSGNSGLVYSISTADSAGYLTAAISDEEYLNTLYSSEIGKAIAPQVSGSSYIITIPEEASESSDESTTYASYIKKMIPTMYQSYAGQFELQDLQNSIFTSDKVENNFFEAYYSKILGSSN